MAPSLLGNEAAGCESPHDWLMSLAIDLAALSDILGVKMAPMEVIYLL